MFIVYEMGSKVGLTYIVLKIMEMFFESCMERSTGLADLLHVAIWADEAIYSAPFVLLLLGFVVIRFGGQPFIYGIIDFVCYLQMCLFEKLSNGTCFFTEIEPLLNS
jgi:hypothetical protein